MQPRYVRTEQYLESPLSSYCAENIPLTKPPARRLKVKRPQDNFHTTSELDQTANPAGSLYKQRLLHIPKRKLGNSLTVCTTENDFPRMATTVCLKMYKRKISNILTVCAAGRYPPHYQPRCVQKCTSSEFTMVRRYLYAMRLPKQ